MRKLLSANFYRLWREKAFWCAAAVTLILSVISALEESSSFARMDVSGFITTPDDIFYNIAPNMGVIVAVFISLFLGTEYSDGTIRNKLLVGHRRETVYAASFLTCLCAGAFLVLVWMLGCVPILFLAGKLEMGLAGFALYLLLALGFTAAFAALFTWIGSLSDNKALTVVFCLAVWLLLLIAASGIYDRLCEPETQSMAVLTVDGVRIQDPEPNPLYVSGAVRTALECAMDFLPTGQAILMADNEIAHPARQLAFSLLLTAAAWYAGASAFCRKNIK